MKQLVSDATFAYMADCVANSVEEFFSGQKDKAYILLNKAIWLKPDYAHALYVLGYFYYRDSKYKEAEASLGRALQINPQHWLAHNLLGDIYFVKGNFEKAAKKYKDVLAIKAHDVIALNNLGLAMMQMERYPEAVLYLQNALRLNANNANIRYNLASVYRDTQMTEEAIAEYKKVIEQKTDYPNVHNSLADLYRQKGRNKEAQEEYHKEISYAQRDLSDRPDDVVILNRLASAYNGIGEYKKAEEIVRKAIAMKPDYRDAYLTLAQIYKKCDRYPEALIVLKEAAALSQYKNFIEEDMARLKELQLATVQKPRELDKIYLKNGLLLEGVIQKETEAEVVLEIYVGDSRGIIKLSRQNIARIIKTGE
jgi:tetratricopeptide (TPR) repeat protein